MRPSSARVPRDQTLQMAYVNAAISLLEQHELFELLPTHGKVVTLDADLPMKHALAALASHSAMCAAARRESGAAPAGARGCPPSAGRLRGGSS